MQKIDVDRIQEFRKCIECFHCQHVCHILREHNRKDAFYGPRQLIKLANLDMHPYDGLDRRKMVREEAGSGFCNITKCCSEVCPEHINLTDNGIIPLKERVADIYFDPILWAARKLMRGEQKPQATVLPPITEPARIESQSEPPAALKQPRVIVKDDIEFDSINPNIARAIPRTRNGASANGAAEMDRASEQE
jgi:succinate dehydrogenase / fumarate reductase iron-sulfur subunit